MKKLILAPCLLLGLLQNVGVATQARKPVRRVSTGKNRKAVFRRLPPPVDPTFGDNVDGDDLTVRRAAADALGTIPGSVVVVEPGTGRILSMVNQKLALTTGFIPCSTVKLVINDAATTENVVSRDTNIYTSRYTSYNLKIGRASCRERV